MPEDFLGLRIKALRELRGISQETLARSLGFKDRQTLSAIETGVRRISAEELVLVAKELQESLEYFTDPYILAGEGRFSWRQTNVGPLRLTAYENIAGRWIGAFRAIARQVKYPLPLLRRALGLTKQHRFEDAAEAGERFAAEFNLGVVPAINLRTAMEDQLGVLVLMVNTLSGISGAACRLSDLDVVFINRNEIRGRQHFDLAHELFHVLTWDAMPPEHIEEAVEMSHQRVEQLANSFASALLMPSAVLDREGAWQGLGSKALISRLNATADDLEVTASALKWRLVSKGYLSDTEARGIRDSALRNNGRGIEGNDPPPLFSKRYVEVLSKGLDAGQISMRSAAALLDVRLDDMAVLFQQHGIELSMQL